MKIIAETAGNQKKVAIIVATISCFMEPFLYSSVTVALPTIGREFAMGPVLLGWISTTFLLVITPFTIPFGRLGDIHGRKKMFMRGLFGLLIASLLISVSNSGRMVIFCRALQGFASAMITTSVIPMLVSVVPSREQGRVLGIATASTYFGLSVGPFIGGLITHYLGWRFIFWFHIILCLMLIAMTHFMLKGDSTRAVGEKFDLWGSVILGCGLVMTMYGFSSLPSLQSVILIALGIVDLVFFVFFERKTDHPIVDINLFRHNRVFAFSNLAALIIYTATFAIGFLMSLYLQKVKALTPQATGLILVAQPILQAVFSPMSGRLSDRMEPRLLATWGMALSLLGLIMLFFLGPATPLFYIVICLMLFGVGFALFSSPNINALMSSVDRQVYGVANATLSTMRHIGMTFSMGIVMVAMSLMMGNAEITPDNPGQFIASMRIALVIFALMCFGGIFASQARGNIKRLDQS